MAIKRQKIQITKSDFKKLQKQLKQLDKGWVDLLELKIIEQHPDEEYAIINSQKIYNVFNQRLSNGAWKTVVYKCAKLLLAELENEISVIKKS